MTLLLFYRFYGEPVRTDARILRGHEARIGVQATTIGRGRSPG